MAQPMLSRIFPRQFDNASYRGHRLAVWLFIPILVVELGIGANSIINTRFVATSADGIPLDSYDAAGAEAVISLFALLGLSRVLLGLTGVMALIRYRAMIPFMYLLLLALQFGTKALVFLHPIASSGSSSGGAGSAVILGLITLMVVGFGLSLVSRERR
jgi:hypothetical protein